MFQLDMSLFHFMHSCGRTVCLQILAVVTGSALHIWVHISFWVLILPGYSLRHWLLVYRELSFPFGHLHSALVRGCLQFHPTSTLGLSFLFSRPSTMCCLKTLWWCSFILWQDTPRCSFDLCVSFNWWFCSPISWVLSLFFLFFKVDNKIDLLKLAPWKWDMLNFCFDHLLQDI